MRNHEGYARWGHPSGFLFDAAAFSLICATWYAAQYVMGPPARDHADYWGNPFLW